MNYQSELSLSSSERRHAWIQRTQHRHNAVDETNSGTANMTFPEFTSPDMADAFLAEGSCVELIHDWLQDCRSSMDSTTEDSLQTCVKGICSKGSSFEDDLSLGAEAIQLSVHCESNTRVALDQPQSKNLHLGNSMTSDSTAKTSSSVSEILSMYEENAEDILFNLGFAGEDPSATSNIPARFFFLPSKAEGIDFRVFLDSQRQRMEREDSICVPANYEIVAAAANALYSLYSHVTREPVENISSRSWTYADVVCMKMSSLKENQCTSPIERLRSTISRMCLFTPPKIRR